MTSKSHVSRKETAFSCRQDVDNDSADVTSGSKSFQICRLTTGKALLVPVDSHQHYLPQTKLIKLSISEGKVAAKLWN